MSLIGRDIYESAALLRLLALDDYAPEPRERPEPGELAVAGLVGERTEPSEPPEQPVR